MQPTLPPPSHLVGLICPADMRHSTYAENERSKYEVPEILARRLSREAGRYLRKTRPPTTALYVPARRGRKAARVHRASAAGGGRVLAQLVRTLGAAARATRRTQGASPLPCLLYTSPSPRD